MLGLLRLMQTKAGEIFLKRFFKVDDPISRTTKCVGGLYPNERLWDSKSNQVNLNKNQTNEFMLIKVAFGMIFSNPGRPRPENHFSSPLEYYWKTTMASIAKKRAIPIYKSIKRVQHAMERILMGGPKADAVSWRDGQGVDHVGRLQFFVMLVGFLPQTVSWSSF